MDQHTAEALRQVGYTMRGITDECLVAVRGGPAWTIDVAAKPVTVAPAAKRAAKLELHIDAALIGPYAPRVSFRVIESWIDSGRVAVSGDEETVERFRRRMKAGGVSSGLYIELADWIHDPRYVFMNHGFAELDQPEDFHWLKAEDAPWRYSINLVRHVLEGVDLTGKRVLDVGCGRGGTCSYLRRYHEPAHVVGLDLVAASIEFCRITHPLDGLEFVEGDAQSLPFEDGSFDVVTNIESSHCYPSLARFYAEVRRVLRPGGVFCYTDNMEPRADNRHDQLLQAAGGIITAQRDITRQVAEGSSRWQRLVGSDFMNEMVDENGSNAAFIADLTGKLMVVDRMYQSRAMVYRSWRVRFAS